jgi:hypothetical protein
MQGCFVPSIVRVVQGNAFYQFKHELFGFGANVGKEAFMGRMRRLFEDAISGEGMWLAREPGAGSRD